MSLYSALSKYNHLSELNAPLEIGGVVKTAAQRRALAIANLFAGDSTPAVAFPDDVDVAGTLSNSQDVGTVTTGATTVATETGDGVWHQTTLDFTSFVVGTSGDNASLALGAKFYTFPAGAFVVKDMVIYGKFTAAISITTDTPEYGVGSVIGSGANATLSTTMEDYIDGGAAGGMVGGTAILPNVAGDTFVAKSMLAASTEGNWIKASGGLSHDLFLNVADGWANVDAAGSVTFTGRISFRWRKLD